MIEVCQRSVDPAKPFENLLPIVTILVEYGNAPADGGFVLNPDGWRCRMTRPLDFGLLRALLSVPDSIELSSDTDTVLDRLSWCSIEGPGE